MFMVIQYVIYSLNNVSFLLFLVSTEDCVLISSSIDVLLVGVSSPEMRAMSCVLGSVPTVGLDIAKHINEYQVNAL